MDNRREEGPADARGLVHAGVVVLTLTCAAAAYRSAAAGDVGSFAFVIVCYGALLLLLRYLRAYDYELTMMAAAAAERERLIIRRKVWALCTLLTAMFAWKVAGVMPWPVAIGVWGAAAATSAGGFVLMFRQQRRL